METMSSIDQLPKNFQNIDLFSQYLANITSYLPLHTILFTTDGYAHIFTSKMYSIMTTITPFLRTTDLTQCMMAYNFIVDSQDEIFKFVHSHFISVFSQVPDLLWDRQILTVLNQALELFEIVSRTVEPMSITEYVSTSHIEQCEIEVEIESIPMELSPEKFIPIDLDLSQAENHVVVDGLNFFASILSTATENQNELGFMDVDRNAQRHQFDSIVEMERVFTITKNFFDAAVPHGTRIHFVVKRFGSKSTWKTFKQVFTSTFLIRSAVNNHHYTLYVAKGNTRHDGEADDRLVVKLALQLAESGDNVCVASNDYYRSMSQHWDLPSYYKVIKDDDVVLGEREIHCIHDIGELFLTRDLDTMKFKFKTVTKMNCETAQISMSHWFGQEILAC
ncbi:hypothetical protein QJ854_gp856 [Moumouvirus goulette]|uniref:Uncharacterized protein n=1 Tax=Moumouvirus goulette TaxID=1247379 RepID=M1PLZ8_9VIRU|nr:hypothetical protein QJ854_gp856 [Moumouvirus goulette]AGF84926.1 hypothetical protein glt_00117 [Moumouvirus goulette]